MGCSWAERERRIPTAGLDHYGEYAIASDDRWNPHTHGGVSGSAGWKIDLPVDSSGRKAVILEGVLFAEGPQEDRKLVAHGENSVRIILKER